MPIVDNPCSSHRPANLNTRNVDAVAYLNTFVTYTKQIENYRFLLVLTLYIHTEIHRWIDIKKHGQKMKSAGLDPPKSPMSG